MVNIRCPYCAHGMGLKDIKPGKYKPKCAKCEKRFLLTLPADSAQEPVVQALEETNATHAGSEGAVSPAHKTSGLEATIQHTTPLGSGSKLNPGSKPATPSSQPTPPAQATIPATASHPAASSNPATGSNPSASKSGKMYVREITKAGHVEATLSPQEAKPDDLTAAPPTPSMPSIPRVQGTSVEMEATTIDPRRKPASNIPEMLGGYKLVKELGRGAMGAVYLAKQLSLDRNVALKLIQAKWASNPVFIARFTREAYAAAQLTHHNVVQIYDLGCQSEINYYTMEFVSGQSLAQLVQKQGKLDAEAAVGYVLQASRGLHFAHMQGMVHRDVKPANLMLNEQGVVKVADMGLVKTPHLVEEATPNLAAEPGSHSGIGSSLAAATAEVTMANIAMGTPAYMAPEQATNAAGVDHRADIYSLGCTLYVLLTGRPPFEGASALEVITKHRTEPIMRPEAIVKRIPSELSNIVLKMVAKRPDDRYQSMNEVIRVLENFLGVQSAGPFSPNDDHAQTLETSLEGFNNVALAKVRDFGMMGFLAGCAGLFVVMLFVKWLIAGAVLAMAASATITYFLVSGLAEHTYLFDKARSYIFAQRWGDWFTVAMSTLVGLLMIWLLGWHWAVLGGAIVGALMGTGFYYAIDQQLAAKRLASLSSMESLLKSLRLRGVEEAAIEQFVVKYTGNQWEEFFEALFGYEAKMRARSELARSEQGRKRHKYATWRDAMLRSIDLKLEADREARDRKHLQKVEEENLKAQGVNADDARQEAQLIADAQVGAAAEVRATPTSQTLTSPEQMSLDPRVIAAQKRDRQIEMMNAARGGKRKDYRESAILQMLAGPTAFTFGPKVRFLAGALCMAAFFHLLSINGVLTQLDNTVGGDGEAKEIASGVFETLKNIAMNPDKLDHKLSYPLVGNLLSHFGTGIAGLVLLVLGMFQGWKMSLFAWPAAIVAICLPALGLGLWGMGYAVAAGFAVMGFLIGRTID